MNEDPHFRIGTAGWSLPPQQRVDAFARREHGLARYARRFDAVEINSSFYRHHRPGTWANWAQLVPEGFRFSAKLPRAITHDARLSVAESVPVLERFLVEFGELGNRAGPILVQLPPSLAFNEQLVERFLQALRARWSGGVACEPRHPSWFDADVDALLARHHVARVAADPARVPAAGVPGGWPELVYVRLHGAPRVYWSSYDDASLEALAERLDAAGRRGAEVWCTFDNTASGAASGDASRLTRHFASRREPSRAVQVDGARAGTSTSQ